MKMIKRINKIDLPPQKLSYKSTKKNTLKQKLFLNVKDLVFRLIPRKLSSKMSATYFQRKKFKKLDWILLHIYLTGKCNLNCVSCSTFAPVADDYMLSVPSFESDCKRLSELGREKISVIHILGGEPLLHPKVVEFVIIARSYFPHAKIKIVTNGTLLLRQKESFWSCCQSNSVDIIVSHYPINLDIKSIRMMIKKYKLNLRYYVGKLPWYKIGYNLNGSYDSRQNFKKCTTALGCISLQNGKIATCQNIVNIEYFNKYFKKNLEVTNADTIDIYKAKSMDEILKFVANPVPFCRYCDLKSIPVKWGISKKEITEWT